MKRFLSLSLMLSFGLSQPVWAQDADIITIKAQPDQINHSSQPMLQLAQAPAIGASELELVNKTGLNPGTAIGLSLVPGLGQFYNGDMMGGSLYLLGLAAILTLDAVMYFNTGLRSNPILLGIPALSAASMVHAGLRTQEQSLLRFSF